MNFRMLQLTLISYCQYIINMFVQKVFHKRFFSIKQIKRQIIFYQTFKMLIIWRFLSNLKTTIQKQSQNECLFISQLIIVQIKELKLMSQIQYFTVNLSNLSRLLHEIEQLDHGKMAIQQLTNNFSISIKDVPLSDIMNLAAQIEKKHNFSHEKHGREKKSNHFSCWAIGQQQLFYYILPYYILLHKLRIDQLVIINIQQKQIALRPLQCIFITKTSIRMLFQVKYICINNKKIKVSWSQNDCQKLTKLVVQRREQKQGIIKWKNISFHLFIASKGCSFHSPRQCRQMWINHVNPKVSKKEWQLQEDYKLFSLLKKYGCKWSLVSYKMKSMRTQHMVKNRANSYLRKYQFRAKHLNKVKIDKIFHDLQEKLKEKQKNKQIQKIKNIKIKEQSLIQQQSKTMAILQQDVNGHGSSLDILKQINGLVGFQTNRIIIEQDQIDQNWQYNQNGTVDFFQINSQFQQNHNNSLFGQLLKPDLHQFAIIYEKIDPN